MNADPYTAFTQANKRIDRPAIGAINLEDIGDIIDKNLSELGTKNSVAYPVLDAADELPAQQGAESDFVPLPAPAAHPSPP